MMSSILVVIISLVLVLSTAARSFGEAFSHAFLQLDGHVLGARQIGPPVTVPPQCQPTCDPINSAISNGCTPAQCCTASFEMAYRDCIVCVFQAVNLTDFRGAQAELDSFAAQCASRGFDIPRVTLPGQSSGSTTSSPSSTTSRSVLPSTTSRVQSTLTPTLPVNTQSTIISLPTPTVVPVPSVSASPPLNSASVIRPPSLLDGVFVFCLGYLAVLMV